MQDRSIGVIALTLGSAVVGLYCQLAAVGLLLDSTVHQGAGTMQGLLAIVVGVVFLVLAIGAYQLTYGFWTRKRWAPAMGMVLYGALIVASLALVPISTNPALALVPTVAAAAALWSLHKPATRLELLGVTAPTQGTVSIEAPARAARLVH